MYTISRESMAALSAADADNYRRSLSRLLIQRVPELLAAGSAEQVSCLAADCIAHLAQYGIATKYHVAWFALLVATFGPNLADSLSRYPFIDEALAEPGATPDQRLSWIESYFK